MRLWHLLTRRLRSLLFRRRSDSELDEELRNHIEQEVELHVSRGASPEEARRSVLRSFGGVTQVKEQCRDARGTTPLDTLMRDLRHGLRRLARDWRFTGAAVVLLSLGIGTNTALFSVINATLFRDSPFGDPDRLVEIYQNARDGSVGLSSYPAYQDVAEYTDVFAGVTAVTVPTTAALLEEEGVRNVIVEYTAPNYASVLGLRPMLGRWFTPEEDSPGAAVVAVLGYRTWQTRFEADPLVVGRTLRIAGTPVTIVGVGPVGYDGSINVGLVTDLWLPIAAMSTIFDMPPQAVEDRSGQQPFFIKARLQDDATVSEAQAAMDTLGTRLAREYPDEDPGRGITVLATADVRVHPQLDVLITALASVLLTVVGLVLAIACSNLATLLLVRGTARSKEVSVRLALGASRWQLVRHLLTESLLLSCAGGVAGCVVAAWSVRAISRLDLPIDVDFSLDPRVLGYAIALSLLTGVAFGLAPALASTRIDLLPMLHEDGGGASPDRRWFTLKNSLVVFQVTVSIVLLAAAGVFFELGSAARAQQTDFAVDGVAILATDARFAGYSASEASTVYERLRSRIAAIPGVQSLTMAGAEPMETSTYPIVLEGAETDTPVGANSIMAGPAYFETLEIPILFGRALEERDRPDTPRVAVISESMAERYFGEVDAVGHRFRIDRDPNWIEVVGVARDTRTTDPVGDLVDPLPDLFYRASAQWNSPPRVIVARTSLDAASLVGAMQRELRAVDSALPVLSAETMAARLETALDGLTAVTTALAILGALGLVLAGTGLYAVVSFAVWQRSREIGIRMALGARTQQVAWSVVRDVAVLLGAGAVVGLGLSTAVTMAMGTLSLPQVGFAYRPRIDPLALAAIVVFVAAVGVVAAFVPARRAARMDPLATLRHD